MGLPFDRRIVRELEKWYKKDHNLAQSFMDFSLRHVAQALFARGTGLGGGLLNSSEWPDGFVGDSFKVYPQDPASLFVTVRLGVGFFYRGAGVLADGENALVQDYGSITGLDDQSPYKPLVLTTDLTFAVPTPPVDSETARIDIIEARVGRSFSGNTEVLKFLDTGSGTFVDSTVDPVLRFALDVNYGSVATPASSTAAISYKSGVSGGAPVPPPVTSGYTKIAQIHVENGVTAIDRSSIVDFRKILYPNGVAGCPIKFSMQSGAGPTGFFGSFPPGIEVYVVGKNLHPEEAFIYVIGNMSNARVALSAAVDQGNWRVSTLQGAGYTLISSDVAAINSSLNAVGASLAAVGDPAFVFDVFSIGGPTNDQLMGVLSLGT